ncbi:uncharacterized protein PG998_007061 [Apiospora kogelbergensis]
MAPLTRLRATVDRVPQPLMKEYYGQRASVPGTLIISEGTFVSEACAGFANAPGIWREDQIAGWRTITDEVHRKGSFIFCQIATNTERDGAAATEPRPMTTEEIKLATAEFAAAAKNAIDAGFDGVEIHALNGFLVDRFLQDVSNQRSDEYGGSVENRSRFVDEIMEAVSDAVGGVAPVGIRLSPWNTFQGMGMTDPIPQFSDLIHKARRRDLAYLHLVESRIAGPEDAENAVGGLDFAYKIWDRPILVAGGYQAANAQKLVDEEHPDKDIVVTFGRYFISNPDLVYRIREGLELSAYDRSTFYTDLAAGYVDYQASPEYLASTGVQAAVA